MSSGSVTISYTTLAEIALAAAVIGGVAFIGSSKVSSTSTTTSPINTTTTTPKSSSSSKKKKRSSPPATQAAAVVEQVQEKGHDILESVNSTAQTAVKRVQENPQVQQVVEKVQQGVEVVQEKVQETVNNNGATSTSSKKNKKKKNGGNKTPPQIQTQEKDDMRDYEVEPETKPARVMKIVGGDIGADPASLQKSSSEEGGWEKADAFEEDDGEWESVTSKKPSRPSTPSSLSLQSSSQANQRTIPGLAPAQTKKQRENAAKKAKEDAVKREKEEEQERRLKAHRDALARARAQEAALSRRPKPSTQNFFGSEPTPQVKATNGNLHAGLDPTSGPLVWD